MTTILNPSLAVMHDDTSDIQEAGLGGTLELIVRDQDEQIVQYHIQPMESFVAGFYKSFYAFMTGNFTPTTDTLGVSRLFQNNAINGSMDAAANDSTYGIQLGTGSVAVTMSDFILGGLISHGTGSGQLSYQSVSLDNWFVYGSVASFRIKRRTTNSSPGTITINEAGAVARMDSQGFGIAKYLWIRDLVAPGVSVAPGNSVEAIYTLKTSV